MTDFLELAFIFIGIAALILLPLSIILLRLTLDRRVRKQLAADKEYNHYPDWYFGVGRAMVFGYASIFTFANNSQLIMNCYDGFDVKAFANRSERFFAYCLVFSLFFFGVGGTIYSLLDWFGVIHLE